METSAKTSKNLWFYPNGRFFQRTQVRREIIRVARLMPRDRQLIGKSCCLVLRDHIYRSSIFEVRMEIRYTNRKLEARLNGNSLTKDWEEKAEMLNWQSSYFWLVRHSSELSLQRLSRYVLSQSDYSYRRNRFATAWWRGNNRSDLVLWKLHREII